MSLPARVVTERLTLDLITPDEAATMLSGGRTPRWHPDYPRREDRDAASLVRPDGPWGPRHITRTVDGAVFGSIGFFGPPSPADESASQGGQAGGRAGEVVQVLEAEIGYGLVPDARGRGVATEAVRALLTLTDALGVRVRASVSPENAAGLRVLTKCGFTELRGANEDGELVMARRLPRTSTGG